MKISFQYLLQDFVCELDRLPLFNKGIKREVKKIKKSTLTLPIKTNLKESKKKISSYLKIFKILYILQEMF